MKGNKCKKVHNKGLFKYHMIGRGGRGGLERVQICSCPSVSCDQIGKGVRRGPKSDHVILEQPLSKLQSNLN